MRHGIDIFSDYSLRLGVTVLIIKNNIRYLIYSINDLESFILKTEEDTTLDKNIIQAELSLV